jgi:hypothetical protein
VKPALSASRLARRAAKLAGSLVPALLALSGCCDKGGAGPLYAEAISRPQAPPAYQKVATAYNARVAGLERLWARANVRVTAVDPEGTQVDENVDGNLQYILPSRVALSISKLGEVYIYVGSNPENYWWIDRSAKPYSARVGRHASAAAVVAKGEFFPIAPLDLVELLGVTPLPAVGSDGSAGATYWSADGRYLGVGITTSKRRVWMWLDPQTYEPQRIEVSSGAGTELVIATLAGYAEVAVKDNPAAHPRLATQLSVSVPARKIDVALRLTDAENRGKAMKEGPYQLDNLIKVYGVERVLDIDRTPVSR